MSITGIGRHLCSPAHVKHNIKRIDRLVGNRHLLLERKKIYSTLSHWLLANVPHSVLLVDGSDLTPDRKYQVIRAAVALDGRSITLYEEIHPIATATSDPAHQHFLRALKSILPPGIHPIIVTDSGFRSTWFRRVEAMGWRWLGRVRNRHRVSIDQQRSGFDCKQFYLQASHRAKSLGSVYIVEKNPVIAYLYGYKKPKQHRVNKTLSGQRAQNARFQKIEKREREPWLIAASPSLSQHTAKQIISLYSKRMQIEESFRDIKSERYGLHLSSSLTKEIRRMEILLLLGSLALMILWLMGSVAEQKDLHSRYQSNIYKNKRILSVIYLGMQVMHKTPGLFTRTEFVAVMVSLEKKLKAMLEDG